MKTSFAVCNFLLISWLSIGAFIYTVYFLSTGLRLAPQDMIAVLSTNPREAQEFLATHIGWGKFIFALAILIVYEIGLLFWVRIGFREGAEAAGKYRYVMYAGRVIVFAAAVLSTSHWIPRIYPAWDYHVANKYLMEMKKAGMSHEQNIQTLQVDNSTRHPSGTVIVVIGESANREHMKAFQSAHSTETTPWLSQQVNQPGFYIIKNAYSNYILTIQALAMYLSSMNQYNGEKPEQTVTITDVANKAGYSSYWISNQEQITENFMAALSAETSMNMYWANPAAGPDENILPFLRKIPKDGKQFVMIHLAGSHVQYNVRYPADYEMVKTDGHNKEENFYDTSIRYNDDVLKEIYEYARDNMNLQAMVYCSDHGEDMGKARNVGEFTWPMVRIPMWIYLSPEYIARNPEADAALRANLNKPFTNDLVFDTVCGILKAPNNHYDAQYDLLSPSYGLTKEKALTMHGEIRIAEDPDYR